MCSGKLWGRKPLLYKHDLNDTYLRYLTESLEVSETLTDRERNEGSEERRGEKEKKELETCILVTILGKSSPLYFLYVLCFWTWFCVLLGMEEEKRRDVPF